MSSEIIFFYVPVPSEAEGQRISRVLLERKLAACTNLLPAMKSQYWWEGKIEQSTEALLIIKTHKDLREKLTGTLQEIHPYDVPCLAEISLENLNAEYKNWLISSLQ